MCRLRFPRQWKWVCAQEFTASVHCFTLFVSLGFPRSRKTFINGVKSLDIPDIHIRALAIISLDWYQVVWHHPLSPPFALLRQSFSFQQRQWPVYPAVLSKCQVLSTLLLIYSLKCSRGWWLDIHLLGSVYMCVTWYNSSQVSGSSFPTCIWFTTTYTSSRIDFRCLLLNCISELFSLC